jgi:uncharacterized membrane protein
LALDQRGAALRELLNFPGAASMQNLHPLVVHFPIVFLISATVLYLIALLMRREQWAQAAFWMLMAGAAAATLGIWTGLRAEDSVMVAPTVRMHILIHHKHLMVATWIMSIVLAGWAIAARPFPRRGKLLFILLLIVMTGTLVHGVDYGGWMVFGYNAGGSLPQPIEFDR